MNKRTIFSRSLLKISSKQTPTQPLRFLSNLTTCITTLQSCAHQKNLRKGRELHAYMLTNGFLDSPLSTTSLVNMYSKCSHIEYAFSVFNTAAHERNVYSYNAIITGFIANALARPAFDFYWKMRLDSIMPDKFTFPCVIKACSYSNNVFEASKIHGLLFKFGLEIDLFISSALIHSYLKFGLMGEARNVFEDLPKRDDVVLWNAMINGYAQVGLFDGALGVFRSMCEERVVSSKFTATGILSVLALTGDLINGQTIHGFVIKRGFDSGVAVINALIDMYGKCKCIEDASGIFQMMDEKDIYSWNSILGVHEQCSDHEGTLWLFDKMLHSGVQPDLVTITTTLPACSHLAALMLGRQIHGYAVVNGLGKYDDVKSIDDRYIQNAIMDMYAKCGSMRDAHLMFDKMKHRDMASWNIMIMGYGMHGFGNQALHMFTCMCEAQLSPDEVTFVGVLSACSHAGLLGQGREILEQMQIRYGVAPTVEHYTCVVDMLGRAGKLEEAYQLLSTMPIESNSVVWRALLAACWLHENTALAEVAANRIFEHEPEHSGNYVLMSNVYGAVSRYKEVSGMREMMRQQNVNKTPGCSWIELGNGVHVFVTGDRTHPEDYWIYAELNSLTARLHEHGCFTDLLLGIV